MEQDMTLRDISAVTVDVMQQYNTVYDYRTTLFPF